jgi:predicted nuclease of predicted toxin-antitoxin system
MFDYDQTRLRVGPLISYRFARDAWSPTLPSLPRLVRSRITERRNSTAKRMSTGHQSALTGSGDEEGREVAEARFLLDQMLSWRVCARWSAEVSAIHVRDLGMESASDTEIWSYARANGLIIVTKDADFRQRSFLFGMPPRVVWLRCGNCSTDDLIEILLKNGDRIESFARDSEAAILILPS